MIRDRIIEALDAAAGPVDVHEVARCVAATIDDPREALAETLPALVRAVLVSRRHLGSTDSPAAGQTSPDAHRRRASGGGNRSAKVAAIREAWRARLNERYATGRGYVRVADLSPDEVAGLASASWGLAASNAAKAQRWEKTHAACAEHSVARVGDLPEVVLRDLFTYEVAA